MFHHHVSDIYSCLLKNSICRFLSPEKCSIILIASEHNVKMSHDTNCSSCHRNDWKPHWETSDSLYKTHMMGELRGRKTQRLVEGLSSCLGYAWGYITEIISKAWKWQRRLIYMSALMIWSDPLCYVTNKNRSKKLCYGNKERLKESFHWKHRKERKVIKLQSSQKKKKKTFGWKVPKILISMIIQNWIVSQNV